MSIQLKYRVLYIFLFTILTTIGFLGERVPLNEGLGPDGAKRYAPAVRNYKQLLEERSISAYYLQRLVPCIMVDQISKLIGLDTEKNSELILGFEILNYVALLVALLFFVLLMLYLNIKPELEFITFLLLFLNFGTAKLQYINPVSTDQLGFSLGMACAYGYFANKNFIFYISILLGIFTFPSFIYIGVVLLLFRNIHHFPPFLFRIPFLNLVMKYAAPLGAIIIASGLTTLLMWKGNWISMFTSLKYQQINEPLLSLSIPLTLWFLYKVLSIVTYRYHQERIRYASGTWANENRFFPIATGVTTTVICYTGFSWLVSQFEPSDLTFESYLATLPFFAVINPMGFIVNHIAYFGPTILLLLIYFKEVKVFLTEQNLGTLLLFLLFSLLALNSETRRYINIYPFFAIVLCISIKHISISKTFILVTMAASLLSSKIWTRLYIPGLDYKGLNILEQPLQYAAMNTGPWTSTQSYYLHIALIIPFTLYYVWHKRKTNAALH